MTSTLNHENLFQPRMAIIREIIRENDLINTYVLAFAEPEYNQKFTYQPGQFMMVSVPHQGEAAISISSSPARPGAITLSVRRAGRLTSTLHGLHKGTAIGLRGPFGRPFPMEKLKGHDLLFVAGGIGLAPLRSVINYCLDQPDDFGYLTVLYGSRSPADLAFKNDLAEWQAHKKIRCFLTVDVADSSWDGSVGVVTTLLDRFSGDCANSIGLVCGPPVMIRSVLAALSRMGFQDEHIITTLERQMKCGVGLCGHCHMDNKMVCVDGPVFSLAELRNRDIMELQE